MIPYLAVAIALLIGFCFGCLSMALAQAAKQQPAGSAPPPHRSRLWMGESPQQHLASSLELLSSLAFVRRDLGEEGYQVVLAATKRIEAAIKQLDREAA